MKDQRKKGKIKPIGFLAAPPMPLFKEEGRTVPVDPGSTPHWMLLFSRLAVAGLLRERPMTLEELEDRVRSLMREAEFSRPDDLVGFLKHILWLLEKEGRVVAEGDPVKYRFL
ncbi:MAG: hypothetical protein NTW26_11945 [bacterium]|nr:hypothetical protein [bacterium]